MKRALCSLLLAATSCVSPSGVVCDNGFVCAEGTTCQVVGSATYCASPAQLDACAGAAEAAPCDVRGVSGACHGGVCLPIGCGNGLQDPDEMCDDGNTTPFDGCSADCRSTELCRNGFVDAVLGEQCDDGNGDGHDGCSASCLVEEPTWTPITLGRPKYGSSNTRLAYDSRRQRVVMFGATVSGYAEVIYNHLHEWDGARWTRPVTDVAPPARELYQTAYDEKLGATVVFSGSNLSPETWLWDGVSWQIAATTMVPDPRVAANMVYDSKRDRIVMFGGQRGYFSTQRLADTWVFDGDWHPLQPPTSPPARAHAMMAYDPKRDRVVLYGGNDTSTFGDVWELDGTTWTPISFTGGPGPRQGAAMAWDPVSGHVVLIGGGTASPADVWDWDGATWTPRTVTFPIATSSFTGGAVTTDTLRGRIVVFADAIYELDGTTWVKPVDGEPLLEDMPARQLATYVFDTKRQRVIAFGGLDYSNTAKNETYLWTGDWTVGPTGPSARHAAGAAFDRKKAEMVMFGGCPTTTTYVGETYTFDTTWHLQTLVVEPSARCKHAMAYDVKHEQIVLFGGLGTGATTLGDTFLWDSAAHAWSLQSPATKPAPLYGASMAYDEAHDQIVLFGGHRAGAELSDETWIWDGSAHTWIKQTPSLSPPRRYYAQMAWDYARRRLVLYGGLDDAGIGSLSDAWEWDGTTWMLVPTRGAPRRDSFGMTPGLDGGVAIFAGETRGVGISDEVFLLRRDAAARYETCTSVDVDGDGQAGCADADCVSTCIPCGDGTCDPQLETCASCPGDCGACPMTCGDGLCQTNETCPGDC